MVGGRVIRKLRDEEVLFTNWGCPAEVGVRC